MSGAAAMYDGIMAGDSSAAAGAGGAEALGSRLVAFREWLTAEANCTVHPSICIVNGEATDGTKNAPVLLFGPPPGSSVGGGAGGGPDGGKPSNPSAGRCGLIDGDSDRALYDRTMGCQIRAAREIKKDETMLTIPRSSMITPDLIASSDAGRAVLACCRPAKSGNKSNGSGHSNGGKGTPNFWDAFENITTREKKYKDKTAMASGTQLLVKILQERKRAEKALAEAETRASDGATPTVPPEGGYKLAEVGTVATRAPLLAFLIHQRFYGDVRPEVKSKKVKSFATDMGTKKGPDASDFALCPNLPSGAPTSFGPYARTLPSYIALPICWKRNELAPLAGCIVGTTSLQEVAATTMQLSADLIALIDGGLLQRFSDVFPPGLITWDRWVWAASVLASRALPASCYLDRSDGCAADHKAGPDEDFYSPPDVWDELGVMVPLLDMLNHEGEANQVTWKAPLGVEAAFEDDLDAETPNVAKAILHKRVKKGCEVYTSYGIMKNSHMICSYGFAQIYNPSDEAKIGWGLFDGVGNIAPPAGYDVSLEIDGMEGGTDMEKQYLVYEASADDKEALAQWWTEERLALLQKETMVDDRFMASLKAGKKMTALAYSDGNYHPLFLTSAAVATMPPEEVKRQAPILLSPAGKGSSIALTKRHQRVLRRYLVFFLTQKLEKLLQNLNKGLKAHFNGVELWTKATNGGLQYNAAAEENSDTGGGATGWQAFFDSYAYATSMEVEKHYYAMGSDSCVLTLYDGSLRSLQISIDGVRILDKFSKGVLKQLETLNMNIARDDSDGIPRKAAVGAGAGAGAAASVTPSVVNMAPLPPASAAVANGSGGSSSGGGGGGIIGGGGGTGMISGARLLPNDPTTVSNDKAKKERPPAVKLHVGNLSYRTTPSELFEYFCGLYGRDNILECHIPTERDSSRSRGFGFITMPKEVAATALHSSQRHQIGDRVLKVAQSNTAGSGRNPSGAPKGQKLVTDAQRAVTVPDIAHVRLRTSPPVGLTTLHIRVEAHVLQKKYTVRRGLVPPIMAAAVLATTTDRRRTAMAANTESTVNAAAAVDGEAEAGVDLPGAVADAAGRLNGRVLVGAGAIVIGIGTMAIILVGGATAAADPENVAGAAEVVGTAIAADLGAVEEMLIGEIATDPAEGRGATEILAGADDHTVGAEAENATGIGIGESGQRRVVADQKKAAVAEKMHEIEQRA
eukprot:CAMPEP_0181048010 /NCGR_PEP_ID=MMETSP1070-20121207/15193_1 /TAXON_ID=265543 /ORGANISM="Minutocellus polymorphus, Strain NH13" /LENGTH=1201 /DNA_ID=CAMNT_0023126737 /DNA_START=254 /DNA_END=3860 /DNA_ORIENTATION=-